MRHCRAVILEGMQSQDRSDLSPETLQKLQHLRHSGQIRAISLDLDDTLWPIWPTIARAEKVLAAWFVEHAPATSQAFPDAKSLRTIREQVEADRPDLRHDLSALRRESIRAALVQCGDDPALADTAFDLFFEERQRVDLFADARETLEFLASRFPVVAISNGNADLSKIGINQYFKAAFSAREFGIAKPDARIFHAAAQAAGHASKAVLHVGDDALLDVEGALGAGMQTAWLNWESKEWPLSVQPHVTVSSLTQLCQLLR